MNNEQLSNKGWSSIADPNTGIKIYDLLVDNRNIFKRIFGSLNNNCKELNKIGNINDLVTNDNVALPAKCKTAEASTNQNGGDAAVQISGDINMLGKTLPEAIAQIKAAVDLKRVAKVDFSYENPKSYYQDISEIQKYIISGNISEVHNNYEDLKAGKVYVIYALRKTKKFSAKFYDSNNTKIDLNVTALENNVGGNLKVSFDNENKSNLSFDQEQEIVFGFKAAKIRYIGGGYSILKDFYEAKIKNENTFTEAEQRLLYQLIDKKYNNKDDFKKSLPTSLNDTKKELLVKLCKFDNFSLEPANKLHHLDGEYDIENLDVDASFVDIVTNSPV